MLPWCKARGIISSIIFNVFMTRLNVSQNNSKIGEKIRHIFLPIQLT